MKSHRLKKGDLVRIVTNTKLDNMMTFIAIIMECRYKSGLYKIYPANSPLGHEPYWITGNGLALLSH